MPVSSSSNREIPAFSQTSASALIAKVWIAKVVGMMAAGLAFFTMLAILFGGASSPAHFGLVLGSVAVGWTTLYWMIEHSFEQFKGFARAAKGMRDILKMRQNAVELMWLFQRAPCFKRKFRIMDWLLGGAWGALVGKGAKPEDDPEHFDHFVELLRQGYQATLVIQDLRERGINDQQVANEERHFYAAIEAAENRLDDLQMTCCWVENGFGKTALKLAGVFAFFVFAAAVLS